jgi:hypothetical protein
MLPNVSSRCIERTSLKFNNKLSNFITENSFAPLSELENPFTCPNLIGPNEEKLSSSEEKCNKMAGKETSQRKHTVKDSAVDSLKSKKIEIISQHVKHFVLCLQDAYGFRDPMEVVQRVSKNLFEKFPNYPIEKLMKWFYGNSLAWCTGVSETSVLPNEAVDLLGLDSRSAISACKIFGGRLTKFLMKFFRRRKLQLRASTRWQRRRNAFSDAQTFLMFKKGSPQISGEIVEEATLKHKKAMRNKVRNPRHLYKELYPKSENLFDTPVVSSETTGLEWSDMIEIEKNAKKASNIIDQVKRIVRRCFKPGQFRSLLRRETTKFPSSSAHSDPLTERKFGGAVNRVRDFFTNHIVGELDRMSYHPRVGVREHYFIDYPSAKGEIAKDILSNEFNAVPVYLREPLKVRTITKGPSTPYWFLRPIQQMMWSSLEKHPVFQLIGRPINSDTLNRMLKYTDVNDQTRNWISGDYSSATDNLVAWLSKKIWFEITYRTGIPDEIYEFGLKALTKHTIVYDDEIIAQQNGQLMGSPLSFPILCIANAAVCMMGFSKDQRILDRVPLCINGDDCVMRYTQEEYSRWSSYAKFIGMTPTPGKCYIAKDWLQMNSELYVLRNGSFTNIPFTNFSLASPFLAKGGQERDISSLEQCCLAFCQRNPKKYCSIWLRRMAPYLKKKVPKLVSWFLPKSLGGLGIMSSNFNGKLFTNLQLRVATLFYQKAVQGELPPYKLSSFKGGELNFRVIKQLKKSAITFPVFEERIPVKEYWSERFFKEKTELDLVTPTLWENIIKGSVTSTRKVKVTSLLTGDVLAAFTRKSRDIPILELKQLLTLRGCEIIIPKEALESNYEPKRIFLDVTASLTNKSEEYLKLLF